MSLDDIEEIARCIVRCNLTEDEAADYAKQNLLDANGVSDE